MTPVKTSTLITSLITQLSSSQSPFSNTSLADNGSNTNTNTSIGKNILLTLHCLFPHDLLLALDIVDRRLIRRFHYTCHQYADEHDHYDDYIDSREMGMKKSSRAVFFVDSTALVNTTTTTTATGSSGANSTTNSPRAGKRYEVRLDAWNCSCPAFAMRAYDDGDGYQDDDDDDDGGGRTGQDWFGGTLVRTHKKQRLPVCKHLLACVLAVKCKSLFGSGIVEERSVDHAEFAGWCAGFAM